VGVDIWVRFYDGVACGVMPLGKDRAVQQQQRPVRQYMRTRG
jgi:hypothetical protein